LRNHQRAPFCDHSVAISDGYAETSLDYDCSKEVIKPTSSTSIIDIASTPDRLLKPVRHHRNPRTLRAELTVRLPPFPLYEFAVMRNRSCVMLI
jgi:hypothetical protein